MDRIIKKIKDNEFTYRLGYELCADKVWPRIEIYKDDTIFSSGGLDYGDFDKLFYFLVYTIPYSDGDIGTIKELFNRLREYSDIPEKIEREFEGIFLMCELNDFKEL